MRKGKTVFPLCGGATPSQEIKPFLTQRTQSSLMTEGVFCDLCELCGECASAFA